MLLGVMGNPIEHSLSPKIHKAFADEVGISIDYQKILVPDNGFRDTVDNFIRQGARGFNITLPHKGDAFDIADACSAVACSSRAVNTIVVEDDGKLNGYNTDGEGLLKDIEQNLNWSLKQKSILILGAGGAVRGVLPSLLSALPLKIDIYNRTKRKAEAIVEQMDNKLLRMTETLNESYDLIISGSSAGLKLDEFDLPTQIVGPQTKTYDMIYSKGVTPFQAWSMAQNCQAAEDGFGMLVEQAALAFTLWTSKPVSGKNLIKKLRTLV